MPRLGVCSADRLPPARFGGACGQPGLEPFDGTVEAAEEGRDGGRAGDALGCRGVHRTYGRVVGCSEASSFLTDLDLIGEDGAARGPRFTGKPPTSTTVEVSRLFIPGALLEVEVVAVV